MKMETRLSCVLKLLLWIPAVWGTSAVAELKPPESTIPANGAILEVEEGFDQVPLQWGRVAAATGYVLDVTGPIGFRNLQNIRVDQESQPTITFVLNGVVPGDYFWVVGSIAGDQVVSGTRHFFTVLFQPTGGGELPAPILLDPFDCAILRGVNGRIAFQWWRVEGATGYRVDIDPGGIAVTGLVEQGSLIRQTFHLVPGNKTKVYTWSVTALDPGGGGTQSAKRLLLFTPEKTEGGEFAFQVGGSWQRENSPFDVNGDSLMNAEDLTALFPIEKKGRVSTFEEGTGPALVYPPNGTSIDSQNALFQWQWTDGARGYEFNVLDDSDDFVTTHFILQPSERSNIAVEAPGFSLGNYQWKVRAFFLSSGTASPYSETRSFSVAGATEKRRGSDEP